MPSEPHDSTSSSFRANGSAKKESVRGFAGRARTGGRRGEGAALRGEASRLDPRQAIHEWLLFAQARGYPLVTGQRYFHYDIDRINTLLEEEKSLFEFCRYNGLALSEKMRELVQGPPTRQGFEHRVFYHLENDPPMVTKITFPGKYGRIEHTPFLYLERLALSNELFPVLNIHFDDCIEANGKEYSIVTSMQAFSGPPPTQEEVEIFLTQRGFTKFSGASLTIDYTSLDLGMHLRDCHPCNWVKTKRGSLIPIDIIPELI